MSPTATRSVGTPDFERLAPLLNRLAELAERELPEPFSVEVKGWDDGTFTPSAYHNRGRDVETGRTARKFIRYEPERNAFVYVSVERDESGSDVLVEREVDRCENPVA